MKEEKDSITDLHAKHEQPVAQAEPGVARAPSAKRRQHAIEEGVEEVRVRQEHAHDGYDDGEPLELLAPE